MGLKMFGGGSVGGGVDASALEDVAELAAMETRGTAERQTALARSVDEWTRNASYFDEFADFTGWTNNGSLTVSGGKVYTINGAAGSGRAAHPVAVTASQTMILRAKVDIAPGGVVSGSNNTLVGLTDVTAGTAPGFAQVVGGGVTRDGRPVIIAYGGADTSGTTVITGSAYVTVVADATSISVSVSDADGNVALRARYARTVLAGSAVPQIAMYGFDTRGTSGNGVDAVSYRLGTVSPETNAHALLGDPAPTTMLTLDGPSGQRIYVSLPKGWKSTRPVPVFIHLHGHDGSELTIAGTSGPNWNRVRVALNAAGIAVASTQAHDNGWGNTASVNDVLALYRYLRDQFPVGAIILSANSMGNLPGLLTLAGRAVPGIVGYHGVDPVTSLASMWAGGAGTYAANIKTAYGFSNNADYPTATAGHDPLLLNPSAFRGVPMRLVASNADTVASRADNADALAARLSNVALVAGSGAHNDPAHVDPTAIVAWAQSVLRS